ncbi:hypothetical protein MMC19_000321 [Ptychographa xylographoides]|nr:hypothetical protein [Ptychographa xylographoides]
MTAITIVGVIIGGPAVVFSHTGFSCTQSVIARVPPSLNGPTNPCFRATPGGYFSGLYYQTYTSGSNVQALRNMWLNTTYDPVTGGNDDVTSFQVPNCDHIFTSYSNNSFAANEVDVFPFHLGGTPQSTLYLQELLAYGTDTAGHDYFVMYGNIPQEGIQIASKAMTGPTSTTINNILSALLALENRNITALANQIAAIPHDAARTGLSPVICDSACQLNQNSPVNSCPST